MIVQFLTPLQIVQLGDGDRWRTLADFLVQLLLPLEGLQPGEPSAHLFVIPAGYETDFASVPRLPLAYLVAGNTAHKAALLHDYLYASGEHPRAWCDAVFRAAMQAEGLSWWRRGLMWLGVRLFGGSHYGASA